MDKKPASKRTSLVESEVEGNEPAAGCGIMGRYPILSVVLFAAVGVGIGLGLSYWEPDDPEDKEVTIKWVGLVGDLFIRALKTVVLPMVFVNVVSSIVDMMSVGRMGTVGVKTVVLYTMTTLIASIIGLISILCFQGLFTEQKFDEDPAAFVKLGCNEDGSFLTEADDGSVSCVSGATDENMQFVIEDVTGTFVRSSGGPANDISMSDTVYEGVFTKLVTDNITGSFVDGNFAAVIFFAIFFGVALGRVLFKQRGGDITGSAVVAFFRELNDVLLTLINWIILATPFAVLSLIAQAVGGQSELAESFENVGWLIASMLVGFAAHFVITDIILHAVLAGKNPFPYLKHIIPAQTTALACASSAATLPVTLRCVKNTGVVPDALRNFVCPLGATINMDGSAIYFPGACIWLALLNGIDLNASHYVLLIILSTIGSAGAAPVPSSGLVLVITAYNTVFNTSGTPNGFEFVVAIDWFLDRLITALNITGDSVVCSIIAARTDFDEVQHLEKVIEEDENAAFAKGEPMEEAAEQPTV